MTLADDDRLALPLALRKRVTWCSTKSSVPMLATIGADAAVTVAPLESRRWELDAVGELLSASNPAERAPLAFVAMSTYSQISLQHDGRLRLSEAIADHLRDCDRGRSGPAPTAASSHSGRTRPRPPFWSGTRPRCARSDQLRPPASHAHDLRCDAGHVPAAAHARRLGPKDFPR